MPNVVLFDDRSWSSLLPLTFTKPVSELRIGITTIKEKWEHFLPASYSTFSTDYLRAKYPFELESDNIFVNGALLPSEDLVTKIEALSLDEALLSKDKQLLAFRYKSDGAPFTWIKENERKPVELAIEHEVVKYPWDIFRLNETCLKQDFKWLVAEQEAGADLHESNTLIGSDIYVHPSAEVLASNLNTSSGPIYIGKGAKVMEGSNLRGPIALLEGAVIKMGSIVYGASTFGPYCKVGGELSNVVMQAFSNKGHAGFLGNAVIGEWCNLGADTNASNLKNNYGRVKVWNYVDEAIVPTDLQFCGLIMGDHAKAGINTMFNTGTVVGPGANVFGSGFPAKHIPSFTWGGCESMDIAQLDKICEAAERMMLRRKQSLTTTDKEILKEVYNRTKKYRSA